MQAEKINKKKQKNKKKSGKRSQHSVAKERFQTKALWTGLNSKKEHVTYNEWQM